MAVLPRCSGLQQGFLYSRRWTWFSSSNAESRVRRPFSAAMSSGGWRALGGAHRTLSAPRGHCVCLSAVILLLTRECVDGEGEREIKQQQGGLSSVRVSLLTLAALLSSGRSRIRRSRTRLADNILLFFYQHQLCHRRIGGIIRQDRVCHSRTRQGGNCCHIRMMQCATLYSYN